MEISFEFFTNSRIYNKWYNNYYFNKKENMYDFSVKQIRQYIKNIIMEQIEIIKKDNQNIKGNIIHLLKKMIKTLGVWRDVFVYNQ